MRRTCSYARPFALLFGFLVALGFATLAGQAQAADLPFAAGSPLIGFTFDDKPLLLPPQQNFQMAMLTAGSELGRTCGKMEAYGWRMNQSEQSRVNTIFNATVDRMRGLGYTVEPQTPNSVSHDITIFTADRVDRHFLFMWSAGEIGLVMTLCETNAPLHATPTAAGMAPAVQTFPDAIVQSRLEAPSPATRQAAAGKFTPVGVWMGGYSCAQGYTGGTLQINHLSGENFDGVFSFYPTPKNMNVPRGSYAVYGQYDAESKRILINPGKWIQRPPHYYNTVIVGGFDSVNNSFSAYFQGINGCTSFEAKYAGTAAAVPHASGKATSVTKKKVVKKKKKAKAVKKPVVAKDAAAATPAKAADTKPPEGTPQLAIVPATAPAPETAPATAPTPPPVTPAPTTPTPLAAPAPTVTPPPAAPVAATPATAPAAPAPAATEAPASIVLQPAAPAATPAVPTPAPAATPAAVPASTSTPAAAPVGAPPPPPPAVPATTPVVPPPATPAATGQKSGAVETDRSKWIKVALATGYENSGQWVTPQAPQAAPPTMAMQRGTLNNVPVGVNPAPPAPAPNYVSPADVAQPPTMISGLPQQADAPVQAMPAAINDRQAPMAYVPVYARDQADPAPEPQHVPDYGYGYTHQ